MFKHSNGWELNARILRLVTDYPEACATVPAGPDYLPRVVREEIAQDRGLVWC